MASLDALQEVIRSDQTITDRVRQQALDWSPLFGNPVAMLEELGAFIKRAEQDAVVEVGLNGTDVTDAGLVNLKGMTNLKALGLSDTGVTNAGLVHLKDLTNLKALFLINTQITDAGLGYLKGTDRAADARPARGNHRRGAGAPCGVEQP